MSVWAQILTSCRQSAESRASREHSRPSTMPGPAQGDIGDQVLEPGPVGGRGTGVALIDVVDVDSVLGLAERNRAAFQVVLPPGHSVLLITW